MELLLDLLSPRCFLPTICFFERFLSCFSFLFRSAPPCSAQNPFTAKKKHQMDAIIMESLIAITEQFDRWNEAEGVNAERVREEAMAKIGPIRMDGGEITLGEWEEVKREEWKKINRGNSFA